MTRVERYCEFCGEKINKIRAKPNEFFCSQYCCREHNERGKDHIIKTKRNLKKFIKDFKNMHPNSTVEELK